MSYEIEFISDSRFGGSKNKLIVMDKALKSALNIEGVSLKDLSDIREIHFPAYKNEEPSISWRKSYRVSKTSDRYTWREVIQRINKIYAPYYKRVK